MNDIGIPESTFDQAIKVQKKMFSGQISYNTGIKSL